MWDILLGNHRRQVGLLAVLGKKPQIGLQALLILDHRATVNRYKGMGTTPLTQLNRGEARHAVARTICHGQRGEIRKRYREGQEDQLGALGLVTNAVVLWNTIYMERALDHLRQVSQIRKEDENKAITSVIRAY